MPLNGDRPDELQNRGRRLRILPGQEGDHVVGDPRGFLDAGVDRDNVDEELYVVLVERAEGQALTSQSGRKTRRHGYICECVQVVYRHIRHGHR